jgi:rhodanese-related sulfurtransferase
MSQPQGIPQLDPLYADVRRRDPVRPALILDVRDADEFAAVRVDGAFHVPFPVVGLRLAEIPKDRPILVMCASGSRSAAITGHLIAHGWTDVGNVAGGIIGWERSGLPVRRGPVAPGEGLLRAG